MSTPQHRNPLADFVAARINDGSHTPEDRRLRLLSAVREIAALYRQAEAGRLGDEPEYAYGYADGKADGLLEAVRVIAAINSGHPDYDPGWRP